MDTPAAPGPPFWHEHSHSDDQSVRRALNPLGEQQQGAAAGGIAVRHLNPVRRCRIYRDLFLRWLQRRVPIVADASIETRTTPARHQRVKSFRRRPSPTKPCLSHRRLAEG